MMGSRVGPRRSEKEDEPGKGEHQAGKIPSTMVNFNVFLGAKGRYRWML